MDEMVQVFLKDTSVPPPPPANHNYIHSLIHSSMALQPVDGPWPLLQFRNLFYTVGRTPWTGDQPVARPLPAHRTAQTQYKRKQTSMPQVGFEATIPVFERAKPFMP
jgi:hypothetical protein